MPQAEPRARSRPDTWTRICLRRWAPRRRLAPAASTTARARWKIEAARLEPCLASPSTGCSPVAPPLRAAAARPGQARSAALCRWRPATPRWPPWHTSRPSASRASTIRRKVRGTRRSQARRRAPRRLRREESRAGSVTVARYGACTCGAKDGCSSSLRPDFRPSARCAAAGERELVPQEVLDRGAVGGELLRGEAPPGQPRQRVDLQEDRAARRNDDVGARIALAAERVVRRDRHLLRSACHLGRHLGGRDLDGPLAKILALVVEGAAAGAAHPRRRPRSPAGG